MVSESSPVAKRFSQRVGDFSVVLWFRHRDPLATDRSEDEDDGEGAGPPEGQESFCPDGRKWEAAPAQKEMMSRAPPRRASVTEKVTGLVSCCSWAL